jgi:hypothetical protein
MIDAIDADGRAHASFGNPRQTLSDGSGPRSCWLSMSPSDELFVAYWFSPVVQVYSAAGELRSVFEIQYKPMQDKLSRNQAQAKTAPGGGRVIGQSIIEAIWTTEAGFFILHRDLQGIQKGRDLREGLLDGPNVRILSEGPDGPRGQQQENVLSPPGHPGKQG